jgi:hypothetical protein
LGSIYWHMVAKLLLAVGESWQAARRDGEPPEAVEALAAAWRRIRGGLGFNKSAEAYGAFPTDPYSHTPKHAGAQQPGMTGQVKEEILARWLELGVIVEAGAIRFAPGLLSDDEFRPNRSWCRYVGPGGAPRSLDLPPGSLAFTFCGTPVVYRRGDGPRRVAIIGVNGSLREIDGDALPADVSAGIFAREGRVARMDVFLAVG